MLDVARGRLATGGRPRSRRRRAPVPRKIEHLARRRGSCVAETVGARRAEHRWRVHSFEGVGGHHGLRSSPSASHVIWAREIRYRPLREITGMVNGAARRRWSSAFRGPCPTTSSDRRRLGRPAPLQFHARKTCQLREMQYSEMFDSRWSRVIVSLAEECRKRSDDLLNDATLTREPQRTQPPHEPAGPPTSGYVSQKPLQAISSAAPYPVALWMRREESSRVRHRFALGCAHDGLKPDFLATALQVGRIDLERGHTRRAQAQPVRCLFQVKSQPEGPALASMFLGD